MNAKVLLETTNECKSFKKNATKKDSELPQWKNLNCHKKKLAEHLKKKL